MAVLLEDHLPVVKFNGLNTNKAVVLGATLAVTGAVAITGVTTFAAAPVLPIRSSQNAPLIAHGSTAAIDATATATAAEVATGYITSTSAAVTTITLPTGTLLGAALGAVAGTIFDLFIDNTAGANTVTMAVAVNGILSTGATDTAGSFGDLTVASGVTGIARYTLMFASATAYVFTRTA